jgi:flavin reductase (DIM6/NTAB) family NADH-FMN oxidoreductase RutF
VCLHKDAEAHDPLLAAGHFGVSVLTDDLEELAIRFSREDPGERFKGLELVDGPLGSPLIQGALAWIECRVHQVFPGGDHSVILGEVVDCEAGKGDPLLFFRGSFMGAGSR